MASDESSTLPEWTKSPPSVFDIVAGHYRESKPRGEGPSLRPCLVLDVRRNTRTGEFACKIAYGTKTLRAWARHDRDIIIQNTSDLDEMGLAVATRFVLDEDQCIVMPWKPPHFGCWTGRRSPRIGSLLLDYQKHYAWIMMLRQSGE